MGVMPNTREDSSSPGAVVRTFLISDIRGYSTFTRERGDETAARLAMRFADLAVDAVEARGGTVLGLRGDEALAVFDSTPQAVRAALEFQEACREATDEDPELPLPVGVGIDCGAAIPVEDGYRGKALNMAARLCSKAAAGQVFVTTDVAEAWRADSRTWRSSREGPSSSRDSISRSKLLEVRSTSRLASSFPRRRRTRAPLPPELDDSYAARGPRTRTAVAARDVAAGPPGARDGSCSSPGRPGIGKTRLGGRARRARARSDGGSVRYAGSGGAGGAEALAAIAEARLGDRPDAVRARRAGPLPGGGRGARRSDGGDRVPPGARGRPVPRRPNEHPELAELVGSRGRPRRRPPSSSARSISTASPTIARSYVGDVDEVPVESMLRASGGVPARVHEVVSEWARDEAKRRLDRGGGVARRGQGQAGGGTRVRQQRDRPEARTDLPVRRTSHDGADAVPVQGVGRRSRNRTRRTSTAASGWWESSPRGQWGWGCSAWSGRPAAGSPRWSWPGCSPRSRPACFPGASGGATSSFGRATIPWTRSRRLSRRRDHRRASRPGGRSVRGGLRTTVDESERAAFIDRLVEWRAIPTTRRRGHHDPRRLHGPLRPVPRARRAVGVEPDAGRTDDAPTSFAARSSCRPGESASGWSRPWSMRSWPRSRRSRAGCRSSRRRSLSCGRRATAGGCASRPTSARAGSGVPWRGSPRRRSDASRARNERRPVRSCSASSARATATRRFAGGSPSSEFDRTPAGRGRAEQVHAGSPADRADGTVEVAHEALIREWPTASRLARGGRPGTGDPCAHHAGRQAVGGTRSGPRRAVPRGRGCPITLDWARPTRARAERARAGVPVQEPRGERAGGREAAKDEPPSAGAAGGNGDLPRGGAPRRSVGARAARSGSGRADGGGGPGVAVGRRAPRHAGGRPRRTSSRSLLLAVAGVKLQELPETRGDLLAVAAEEPGGVPRHPPVSNRSVRARRQSRWPAPGIRRLRGSGPLLDLRTWKAARADGAARRLGLPAGDGVLAGRPHAGRGHGRRDDGRTEPGRRGLQDRRG